MSAFINKMHHNLRNLSSFFEDQHYRFGPVTNDPVYTNLIYLPSNHQKSFEFAFLYNPSLNVDHRLQHRFPKNEKYHPVRITILIHFFTIPYAEFLLLARTDYHNEDRIRLFRHSLYRTKGIRARA